MKGSFNFLLHLFGFGIIVTTLLAGWILERQQRKEQNIKQKLYIFSLSRKIGILSPIAALIMLVTGIVNIYNTFGPTFNVLYSVGWLAAKIVLFAFLVVNGAAFGPLLNRKRMKLLKTIREEILPENLTATLKAFDKNISTFYVVQWLLLVIITFLSVFGTGKHNGIF